MKQVLILTGLSGSGKTTFARQFCAENPNWLRVNLDDFRRSLLSVSLREFWETWPSQEKDRLESLVSELQKTAILDGLTRGWHIVIDNTTLKLSYINEFRRLLATHFDEVKIQYKLIDVPVDECVRRDQNRLDSVGEEVIRKQAEQLIMLKKVFKFRSETLTRNPAFQRAQDESLPHCVLVDIDGTVAKREDRSPFDWRRVGIDIPRWPIINLVKSLQASGYTIIFLSGRDAVCRPETMAWLTHYFGWQPDDYQLYMRPQQDNRKDVDIKYELFEQYILGHYYVELVVDDRQQVVDMWRRQLGLTCVQVNYGDF